MNSRIQLDQLSVASPCEMSWEAMRGDDQARFCDQCEKHVYDFAAMTTAEGLALIERTEGKFCGRLTRRADGTVLTADCPIGLSAKISRFRRRVVYSIVAAVVMLIGFLTLRRSAATDQTTGDSLPMINAKIEEWIDTVREWAGLPPRRTVIIMGEIPPPPPVMGKIVAPRK
jgi:hypothetical protein